jgi:hypothetical protein
MSDAMQERGRALEEEYFRRKDRELVEKIRRAAEAKAEHAALGSATGLTDPALLDELRALGFTPDTVNLLPLLPMLQVAWAEGGITDAERDQLLKIAAARGITEGSAASEQLIQWMVHRPADAVFTGAGRLIAAMLASGSQPVANLSADDLVKYCESIASASGGIFGVFGRVSAEEKALLGSIAAELTGRRK